MEQQVDPLSGLEIAWLNSYTDERSQTIEQTESYSFSETWDVTTGFEMCAETNSGAMPGGGMSMCGYVDTSFGGSESWGSEITNSATESLSKTNAITCTVKPNCAGLDCWIYVWHDYVRYPDGTGEILKTCSFDIIQNIHHQPRCLPGNCDNTNDCQSCLKGPLIPGTQSTDPAAIPDWYLGKTGESCDEVCNAQNMACDLEGLRSITAKRTWTIEEANSYFNIDGLTCTKVGNSGSLTILPKLIGTGNCRLYPDINKPANLNTCEAKESAGTRICKCKSMAQSLETDTELTVGQVHHELNSKSKLEDNRYWFLFGTALALAYYIGTQKRSKADSVNIVYETLTEDI